MRPPLMESYWVLPGRLLAGEYPAYIEEEPAGERLTTLLAAGIDTFIDLTESGELPSYLPLLQQQARARGLDVTYQRFPILDRGLPEPAEMRATLDGIDAALTKGHKVYLHCWGGVGRTGTTVGCYLVRHGKTGPEALDQLAEWWLAVPKHRVHPQSPETPEQARYVLNWQEHLSQGFE